MNGKFSNLIIRIGNHEKEIIEKRTLPLILITISLRTRKQRIQIFSSYAEEEEKFSDAE